MRNMIPPNAQAIADVRVLRVADYDGIEQQVKERIKNQLIPDTKVEMNFERRRPPLESPPRTARWPSTRRRSTRELGRQLVVADVAEGGGTDAAFAALIPRRRSSSDSACRAYGAHSSDAEYVLARRSSRVFICSRA